MQAAVFSMWCNQKLWQSIDTFLWVSYVSFYKRWKQEIRGKTIAQWVNKPLLKYSFIGRWWFPLLCEKTGAIALALLGLMAGKQNSAKLDFF